ncbi:LytTR family transcriptional regulator DNA-binding domain-containing protein [Paenibacillus sp. FSL R7-0333]|uniref:LytTR family transcriptional regulator DNA-binding domain-containing protein n=1 Tax=Paenibacillus sp. FSL R7-0333 TaxID=1926587 RepID=UPI00096E0EFF|nr:hypothetical protein BK146_16805 [Paenibacillus sp. FSL R7-0333]
MIKTISATLDEKGNSGIINVLVDEVYYLGVESRSSMILLETPSRTYYTPGTLNYWTHVLNRSGYHFHIADRSNSINISKIVEVDERYKIAFFDKHDRSKKCTMSSTGKREVMELLSQTNTPYVLL